MAQPVSSRSTRALTFASAVFLLLSSLVIPRTLAAQDEKPTVDLTALQERLGKLRVKTHSKEEYESVGTGLQELLAELDETLADESLEGLARLDTELLRAQTRLRSFEISDLGLYQLNPTRYLDLDATNSLFTRPCALPDAAIEKSIEELRALPAILDNARINLGVPARTWTENAIENTRYASAMLTEDIHTVCVDSPEVSAQLADAAAKAARAVEQYRAWLTDVLLPRSNRPPTWTPAQIEVYQFEHEFLLDYGVDEMLAIAREDERVTRAAMHELAKRIHPSGDLHTVWELMKDETPPWSEVPAMAQRYVDLAAKWLTEGEGSHLVAIPERFDYGVQLTAPMGRRILSFGGADYGPSMAGRISGYYVLTPIEPWLSDAEKESRLRSYNPYWTHVISYHEWLGHNVQRAVAHQFAEGPIRRGFNSIYLSQSWSFYLEKLLDEQGYYEDMLPHVEGLKTRMARLQMRMWRIQRILTKLRMAKDEMTFEQAVDAYVDEIGMERTNALIEVQRDSQSPSPPGREIIGELFIESLRDEYMRRMGGHGTLKGFHEALLRYGNLPLPMVRKLMFGDL